MCNYLINIRIQYSWKFLFLFVILFYAGSLVAQRRFPREKPQLIVQIVVGQLRADYFLRFQENLSEEGFKILITEGAFCQNARYGYLLTQTASGLATIATGAMPSSHGIVANKWYDRTKKEQHNVCVDRQYKLVESNNDYLRKTPYDLVVSTFADELKLLNYKSKIIGIGIEPEEAILLTGHNADAIYWFDDDNGKFVSSKYYLQKLPVWVKDFNNKEIGDLYLERKWESLLPASQYLGYTLETLQLTEKQKFIVKPSEVNKKGLPTRKFLKNSPFGDNLVKDFAISAIVGESLGQTSNPDMISIYFSGIRNIANQKGQLSVQVEDAFYRMDENIKYLLAFLQDYVGKENLLLVLTSDHGASLSCEYLKQVKMQCGSFDYAKASILLRSYLGIIYGKGDWIHSFSAKQLYLNQQLIEDSNLNLNEIQERSAKFLLQFTGISNAVPAYTLASGMAFCGILQSMQNSYYPKRSPDVMINLESGWNDGEDSLGANSAYSYDVHVPLIFYGWRVKRKTISRPIDMSDIAPSLSTLVGIPFPDAASGRVIQELID
ncbi:MAG: alkaline phosphatase family protein [Bacteroidales bacterium]